jgi:hypothetical protein
LRKWSNNAWERKPGRTEQKVTKLTKKKETDFADRKKKTPVPNKQDFLQEVTEITEGEANPDPKFSRENDLPTEVH